MNPSTLNLSAALLSFVSLAWFLSATYTVQNALSPEGCRMSRMWPSIHLQTDFDTTWTSLARRYRLVLYREKEQGLTYWQQPTVGNGLPVLFIPGNAGSYNQCRSIASSAARQYFASPGTVSPEFRSLRPLDFFSVDFNEDLSAFHGPTMDSEIEYTSRAISYILSLYPPGTQIIIMGHSMGGVIATSLLPSPDISAIITMSTPHTLPPARFDARIDGVYDHTLDILRSDPTPILSICGGATDLMIPSESCILPDLGDEPFRRTVFSSALEGAWTGVGHNEMVWCHQVRWRIARAALALGSLVNGSPKERGLVLDRWLRDGHNVPAEVANQDMTDALQLHDPHSYQVLPEGMHLVLKKPVGEHAYLLPLPSGGMRRTLTFILYVSQGAIGPVAPHVPLSLKASVYHCLPSPADNEGKSHPRCRGLKPNTLKLIPNPIPGRAFPYVRDKLVDGSGGVDESEGVVLYEADVEVEPASGVLSWIAVKVEDAQRDGWIVGGFEESETVVKTFSTIRALFSRVPLPFEDHTALRTRYRFPGLTSNALIVYSVSPVRSKQDSSCQDPLLSPLISHTSHPSETHYFSTASSPQILLHTHAFAPYVARDSHAQGVSFSVYSSGSAKCRIGLDGFILRLDLTATAGRWTSRYFTTVTAWSIALVLLILFHSMSAQDARGSVPSVGESIAALTRGMFPKLLAGFFFASFVPSPVIYLAGNGGAPLLAGIAPLLLTLAMGLLSISWGVLLAILWPLGKMAQVLGPKRRDTTQRVQQGTVMSMVLIFVIIFLFVPWQVAYLGCWFIHLFTCARSFHDPSPPSPAAESTTIPLLARGDHHAGDNVEEEPRSSRSPPRHHTAKNVNENLHILLLMTWLLPLAAPVLVVWVRTLMTAGITTPFNGDHDFFNVAPFLVLVDFASWNQATLFERQSFERRVSVRWTLPVVSMVSFLLGSRKPYIIFDLVKVAMGSIVTVRIGRRYWGRPGWSPQYDTS